MDRFTNLFLEKFLVINTLYVSNEKESLFLAGLPCSPTSTWRG